MFPKRGFRCLFYFRSWNGCYRSCEPHTFLPSETLFTLQQAERGIANKGDEVEIVGFGSTLKTTLTGIGMLPLLCACGIYFTDRDA
jgi:hypothetical protein